MSRTRARRPWRRHHIPEGVARRRLYRRRLRLLLDREHLAMVEEARRG